jgi:hypothetical protein
MSGKQNLDLEIKMLKTEMMSSHFEIRYHGSLERSIQITLGDILCLSSDPLSILSTMFCVLEDGMVCSLVSCWV